jgi:uncharacterized damage-inducible protein DinB
MNTSDVLKYGHLTVVRTLENIPQSEWEQPNVCGVWSVKDIVAHLSSFEHILVDVLNTLIDEHKPTPVLDLLKQLGDQGFNDAEVKRRKDKSPQEVYAEYSAACAQAQALLGRISEEVQEREGTLPWYGRDYDLEDYIVYTFYGHKREHCAQIDVFGDTLKRR